MVGSYSDVHTESLLSVEVLAKLKKRVLKGAHSFSGVRLFEFVHDRVYMIFVFKHKGIIIGWIRVGNTYLLDRELFNLHNSFGIILIGKMVGRN